MLLAVGQPGVDEMTHDLVAIGGGAFDASLEAGSAIRSVHVVQTDGFGIFHPAKESDDYMATLCVYCRRCSA